MKKSYSYRYVGLLCRMPYFLSSGDIFREKPLSPVWFLRQNMLFFTGAIAWCLMTLTMCLSLRSSWLNKVLDSLDNSLDKAWRLHKWAGECAIAFAFPHWLDENLPQSLAGLLIPVSLLRLT
ncbi:MULTISPECIES: ferric reductase-like transmembrane domain-containing protein [unclassified Escherichia]|uniref:ferric reductase-like transmembrane domain-containing protein n=1 Tax=unclassified Escherichia TaxID=2608889 RepID=UPI001F0E8364|nr:MULTISPECIES: ferric reductase-like transmembrane domain-containing protein [unclassified Escherichia]